MLMARQLGEKIRAVAQTMRVLSITGPRQSGKTTLARQVFPDFQNASRPLSPDLCRRPTARSAAGKSPALAGCEQFGRLSVTLVVALLERQRSNPAQKNRSRYRRAGPETCPGAGYDCRCERKKGIPRHPLTLF